eukprot:4072710-Lingulodinium_polyedra.AAC.1
MRAFFTKCVPFGQFVGLTHFGFLLARLVEDAERTLTELERCEGAGTALARHYELYRDLLLGR